MNRFELVVFVAATGCSGWLFGIQGATPPESIPTAVKRLSGEVKALQTKLDTQKTTIDELQRALAECREQVRSGLDSLRSELAGAAAQAELRLRSPDGHASGAIRDEGLGYGLSLSAQTSGQNVELVARGSGGFLRFWDETESLVAQLGADKDDGAGYVELMSSRQERSVRVPSARLGSQKNQVGGALTLYNEGKEMVQLSTTRDGCGLILGDPNQVRQHGIVLSVSPKGSYIQVDGVKYPQDR